MSALIWAQLRKELRQLRRDRTSLAMALILPAVLMVLLGTAISLDVKDIPVTVTDLDQTPSSRAYLDSLRASLVLKIVPGYLDAVPERALQQNRARAVIVIPPHFGRDLLRGGTARVEAIIDATDANTANVLRGSLSGITRAYAASLQSSGRRKGPAPVQADIRLWFNPGRSDRLFIGSGAIAVVLALLPPLLASLAMSREVERMTILQVYVSAVPAFAFLLGKILAYSLVSAVDSVLLFALARAYFGLPFRGDPGCLLVGSVAFILCTMSFGTMVGSRVRSQGAAIQAMQLGGVILSFLLSGFIFPLEQIPRGLRWISQLTPAKYYIDILRDSFLRGGGWVALGPSIAALTLMTVLFFAVAWRGMRKMQLPQ